MASLKVIISLLKKYLKPYIGLVAIVSLLMIIYNAVSILNPQIIRFYIDSISEEFNTRNLIIIVSVYAATNCVVWGIYVLMQWTSQNLAWQTTNNLRVDLTKHCMNLDMGFHNEKKTGEMIERIDGDASTLANFFSYFLIYFVGSILLMLGVLVAIYIEGWVFGLIFTGFVIIAIIAFYFVRNIVAPWWKKVRESTTALFGNIEESISSFEDVKANGADEFLLKNYHKFAQADYQNRYKAILNSRIYTGVNIFFSAMMNITVFVISYFLFDGTGVDAGTLYLLLSYITSILRPIRFILWQIEVMQNALANIERIDEWFNLKSNLKDTGKKEFPDEQIGLAFDNITFGYNDDKKVLKNISFNLKPTTKLGLVGHTGSGKTTIARLIFRMHDPQKGRILCGDIDSRDLSLKELRSNIAYVTQDVELFKASVKDNITFFSDTYSDEEVLAVIKKVGLNKWLNKLPYGLETEILSEEGGLSAGEEQLLALSRAFLKKPKIVVLDEASSRLDPATERKIDRALEKLMKGRSAIIIAHRLSTLDKVDDILILDNGEITEYGPRDELINDSSSIFNQLLIKGMEEVLQ